LEDTKTNRLCKICEAKLKAGIISENDIKLWKEIVKLAQKNFMPDFEFIRSFEINGAMCLVCKGNIGALIGKGGKNIREFEKILGKKIRIIEKTGTEKDIAQTLLGRAKILAVNKVFKPDSEELRIIVSKGFEKRLPDKQRLEEVLAKILGKKTGIEFE